MIDTSRFQLKFIPMSSKSGESSFGHQVDTSGELHHLLAKKGYMHQVVDKETGKVIDDIYIYRDGDAAVFVHKQGNIKLFSLEEFFEDDKSVCSYDTSYSLYDGPPANITSIGNMKLSGYGGAGQNIAEEESLAANTSIETAAVSSHSSTLGAGISGSSVKGIFVKGGWMLGKLALGGLALATGKYAYDEYQSSQDSDSFALSLNPSNGILLSGKGEPGSTIAIDINGDGNTDYTTQVNQNGNWSYKPDVTLAHGSQVNVSINIDGRVQQATVVIDTSLPSEPIFNLAADSDSGLVGDQITNDTTPTINGRGIPGTTIKVTMPGTGEELTTVVDAKGNWSVTPLEAIADGVVGNVVVRAYDASGEEGQAQLFELTIDTSAPNSFTGQVDGSTNGANVGSVITSDATPTISGQGEPGDTIIVIMPGTNETLSVTVEHNGTWSVTPDQAINHGTTGTISITAIDPAGNVSDTLSMPVSINLNDVAQEVTQLAEESDSGQRGDGITFDDTPTIEGVGTAGDIIEVKMPNTGELLTTTVNEDGKWEVTATQPLADGTSDSIMIVVKDAQGNVLSNETLPITIDMSAPEATAIISESTDSAELGDGITSNSTPTIEGTAEAGALIIVTFPSTEEIMTTQVNDAGQWSVTPTQAIPHGTQGVISVAVVDVAGNRIDYTMPLQIDTVADAVSVNPTDGTSLTGTAEPGMVILVDTNGDGKADFTVTASEEGTWSLPLDTPLAVGTSFSVIGVDKAGNATQPINIDITNEDVPHMTGDNAVINGYDEGEAAVTLVNADNFSLLDNNSNNMLSATVSINEGFELGDTLSWDDIGNVTGTFDIQTGVLTLTGNDSIANYEKILETVKFSTIGVSGTSDVDRTISIQVTDSENNTGPEYIVKLSDISPAIGEAPESELYNFTEDTKPGLAKEGKVALLSDGTQVTVADTMFAATDQNGNPINRTGDISLKFYNKDGSQTDWIDVDIDGAAANNDNVHLYNLPNVTDFSYTDSAGNNHSVLAVGTTTQGGDGTSANPYTFQSQVSLIEYHSDGTVTVLDTVNLNALPGVALDQLANGDLAFTAGSTTNATGVLKLDNATGKLTTVNIEDTTTTEAASMFSITATAGGGFIRTFGNEMQYYSYDDSAGTDALTLVASKSVVSTNDIDGLSGTLTAMSWTNEENSEYFVSTNDSQVFVIKLDPDAVATSDVFTQTHTLNFDANYRDAANPNGLGLTTKADQIQFTDIGNNKALVVFGEENITFNGQLSAGIWNMETMAFDKPVQQGVLDNYFDPISVAYDPTTQSVILGGEMPFDHNGNALNDPTFYRFTLNDADHGSSLLVKCVGFVEVANGDVEIKPFQAISLSDSDSSHLGLIKISIVGGFDPDKDSLGLDPTFTLPDGVQVVFNNTTGHLLISGVDEVADYQNILHNIEFQTSSSQEGNRSLELTTYDSSGNMDESPLTMVIQVQEPNEQIGTTGDDILSGGIDIDNLIGGAGNDTLTGGFGQDIFTWNAGDDANNAVDTITDFKDCFQDDKLDLSGLLVGETDDAASLTNFLAFALDGSDTVISVKTDGDVNSSVTQTIRLNNVDLTKDQSGGALTDEQIIQSLLDDNQLIVG